MLCNYFWMFYLSSLSLMVSAIASLLQNSLGRWQYARSVCFSFQFLLLSLKNLLIPLPIPLLELIASCVHLPPPTSIPQLLYTYSWDWYGDFAQELPARKVKEKNQERGAATLT